jgi:hypothetical protein
MYVVPNDRLRPGDQCETSGVYRVYHHAHRLPHSVFIPAGTVLPTCRRCGDKVEFGLLLQSEPLTSDHDLLGLGDRMTAEQ